MKVSFYNLGAVKKFGQVSYQRVKEKNSLDKQVQTILVWYNKFI